MIFDIKIILNYTIYYFFHGIISNHLQYFVRCFLTNTIASTTVYVYAKLTIDYMQNNNRLLGLNYID